MEILKNTKVTAPVKRGDIIISNILDTGSDTAYFPHFHCSSQVVREIIIDIISIGMSKKLIYIVPLFSNMNINAIIMAISIITRGKPYFFLIVRKSFVNSPFISFPPLHRKA